MIKYILGCTNKHTFEAWFRSSDDFVRQSKKKLIACPECGSVKVTKQPTAPAIIQGRGSKRQIAAETHPPATAAARQAMEDLKAAIVANTEDVGPRFAEEARRIHEGDAAERGIRGIATTEEARGLVSDGIPFGLLPKLRRDHN